MNERHLKRLKYIRDFAHDEKVSIRAQFECGKIVPNLKSIQNLYQFIEELSQMLLDERQ